MSLTQWLILFAITCQRISTVRCLPCRTADNRPGDCVGLLKCSPLQQASLLAVNLNELVALVAYIRQSLCGFDGTILLVCCTDAVSAISSVALASSVMPISPEVGLQFYEPFTFGPLMSPPSVLVLTSEQPATIIGNSEQPTTVTMLPQPVGPGAAVDAVCGISNFTQTRVVGGMNAKLSKYVINTTMYAGFRHCFFPQTPTLG